MESLKEIKDQYLEHDILGSRTRRALTLGTSTNSRSFDMESWAYVQHKDFRLQLLQKSEKPRENRPIIPNNECQRLAFLRGYTTSPFKIQMVYLQELDYSNFFWIYVMNVIFRSLPTNYVQTFLAAYNPDEQLFASKIFPLAAGVSWQVVICGIVQLIASADLLALLLQYAINGIIDVNPWNKCLKNISIALPSPYPYRCYSIEDFLDITEKFEFVTGKRNVETGKAKINFLLNYYIWDNNTSVGPLFTSAPQAYFLELWGSMNILESKDYLWILNYTVIWLAGAAFYKQIFKQYVWKTMMIIQATISLKYLLCLLYIFYFYLEHSITDFSRVYNELILSCAKGWDFDMQAESMTGPPVIQLLASRSGDQISPGRDSFMITASNSLMYLFKGLVNYKMKSFVESRIRVPFMISAANPYPMFYFWPLFFHGVAFGNFAIRVFYILSFLLELLLFMMTFQIVVEVIVGEWERAKRWIVTIVISVIGLMTSCLLVTQTKGILYVVTTMTTSLTEAIVLCWLYPLGRLTDDIHFHYGTATSWVRIWSIRLMPLYLITKVYIFYKSMYNYMLVLESQQKYQYTRGGVFNMSTWVWLVGVLPLPLGVFYSVYKNIIVQRKSWWQLIKPRPDWGPREHITRQLRKLFDSREYIGSKASRYLSRHILAKAQTATCRLDIKYDTGLSTETTSNLMRSRKSISKKSEEEVVNIQ